MRKLWTTSQTVAVIPRSMSTTHGPRLDCNDTTDNGDRTVVRGATPAARVPVAPAPLVGSESTEDEFLAALEKLTHQVGLEHNGGTGMSPQSLLFHLANTHTTLLRGVSGVISNCAM